MKKMVTDKSKSLAKKPRLYRIGSISYVYHISLRVSEADRDSMTIGEMKNLQKKLQALRFTPVMIEHAYKNIDNKKVIVMIK